MDIVAAFFISLLAGIILAVVLGNPLVVVPALIVGALFANRRGYAHQAQATRRAFDAPPSAPPARVATEDRLAEIDRLRAAGTITDAEATDRRKAILDSI